MGSCLIVVDPPGLDEVLGLHEIGELRGVQAFVSQLAVDPWASPAG